MVNYASPSIVSTVLWIAYLYKGEERVAIKPTNEKHQPQYPTARKIRRACSTELYRTFKRLKLWVPQDRLEQAEQLYYRKVVLNLPWITENHSNRKLLSDWWDENVSPEIAELINVDRRRLSEAFRDAFGG